MNTRLNRLNTMLKNLKDPLIKGHPLHAILTDLPVGATVLGATCDVMGLATQRPAWRFAARVAHTSALASGAAVALTGLWDYQAVPREHPARRVGALHGYINAGAMTLLLASALLRGESRAPENGSPNLAAVALGGAALATLTVSGWLGGELVFHLGWRVNPAERAEQLEDALRKRGETALVEQANSAIQQYEQEHALIP